MRDRDFAQVAGESEGFPVSPGGSAVDPPSALSELSEALSLLRATLESTADGILVVDQSGSIRTFNARFTEMWRIPDHILDARDDEAALGFVVSQLSDPDSFVAKVRELYATPDAESFDTVVFQDGRIFERYSKPQRVGDQIVGRVWSFRDVSERKQLEDRLAHQAFHDALTNLANQALFRDRVEHAVARVSRSGARLAILVLDLDNFKTVNDSIGHPAGDLLLVAAAERLVGCLRTADTAARLGGDEFAVLLEDAGDDADVVEVAERILAAFAEPFLIGSKELFSSISIGVAFHAVGTGPYEFLSDADLAMYTAKRKGKARYEVFKAHMHEAAIERLEVEASLRRATGANELVLHYQPIVELATGAVVGVEALVRWAHPDRGLLFPQSFIAIAEETGLISELDRFVLAEACAQCRNWQREHANCRGLTMSVNLSSRQLVAPDLVSQVRRALDEAGLSPGDLILEVTEVAMMRDTQAAARNLRALSRIGVRFAVDDFGTGYSSLSHLHDFPIHILKIDRSFVEDVAGGPGHPELARAIVGLARTLGLVSVAEGIETAGQAQALHALECDLGQGFYLCEPREAAGLDELLGQGCVPLPTD
jgi:diguanylate cyclase (GGDEF)-like protein